MAQGVKKRVPEPNVNGEKGRAGGQEASKNPRASRAARWAFLRRPPSFLDPIMNRFESLRILGRIRPYVGKGQLAADLGCGWGHYTFVLADLVGPNGKVYSVDLSKNCIGSIQKKKEKGGIHHIEAHASSAASLDFIEDGSVDFVFANGLLCSMVCDRESAISEVKRILKPGGRAYISLGAQPPFGLVDEAEWNKTLEGFKVIIGGAYKELWVVVSLK